MNKIVLFITLILLIGGCSLHKNSKFWTKTKDIPEEKKRGNNYILVYKIIGSEENIVQVEAGYKYNLDKDIVVKIDNEYFSFYSTEDSSETAWTDKDNNVIYAMKKGLELVLSGQSSRGTITNDTYTLKGFTSAINNLNKDC